MSEIGDDVERLVDAVVAVCVDEGGGARGERAAGHEHDARSELGRARVELFGEVHPRQILHHQIAVDGVETRIAGQKRERLVDTGRDLGGDVFGTKSLRERPRHQRIVLDDEHAHATGDRGRFLGPRSAAATSFATGNSTRNEAPPPGRSPTTTSPPNPRTTLRHTNRPSPVPTPTGFVVTNGSKMRSRSSSFTPGPLSVTSITTWSPTSLTDTEISMLRRGALGQGLNGVHDEIHHDLNESRLVAEDRARLVEDEKEARASFDLLAEQFEHVVDDRPRIDRLETNVVRTAEGAKVAGDRCDALDALLDGLERFARSLDGFARAGVVERGLELFEVRHDVSERVVDLVRDARGEGPERHDAIGLDGRRLELPDLAHVVRNCEGSREYRRSSSRMGVTHVS